MAKRVILFCVLALPLLGVALLFREGAQFIPYLARGAWVTAQVSVLSILLALGVSFLLGLAKLSIYAPIRIAAAVLVEALRGSSLLVYLFWLYYVAPEFGLRLDPITTAVVAIGLNYGAYGAEIVRGVVQSVAREQWEACLALNITRGDALRRIIIPQQLAIMIPPFSNLFIQLIKGTAIISAITVTELTAAAIQLNQMHLRTMTLFGMILVVYYALSLIIRFCAAALERRLTRHRARTQGARAA